MSPVDRAATEALLKGRSSRRSIGNRLTVSGHGRSPQSEAKARTVSSERRVPIGHESRSGHAAQSSYETACETLDRPRSNTSSDGTRQRRTAPLFSCPPRRFSPIAVVTSSGRRLPEGADDELRTSCQPKIPKHSKSLIRSLFSRKSGASKRNAKDPDAIIED